MEKAGKCAKLKEVILVLNEIEEVRDSGFKNW